MRHLTMGTAIAGVLYDLMIGGAHWLAALDPANSLACWFSGGVAAIVNAHVSLELAASAESVAWVDARLTLRLGSVVYALRVAGLAWLLARTVPADFSWRSPRG